MMGMSIHCHYCNNIITVTIYFLATVLHLFLLLVTYMLIYLVLMPELIYNDTTITTTITTTINTTDTTTSINYYYYLNCGIAVLLYIAYQNARTLINIIVLSLLAS